MAKGAVKKKTTKNASLPEELNIKIFSYLDQPSLKNVSKVCKKWRSTIYGCMALMDNSILLVHNFKEQKKLLEKYGKCFRTVKLVKKEGPAICLRSELVKVLTNIPSVENLEISERSFRYLKNEVTHIPLDNLKELSLHNSANTYRISQFLETVKLETLTLRADKIGNFFDDDFIGWLTKQEHLKNLKIQEKALKIFLKPLPIQEIKFKLKKLIIHSEEFEIRNALRPSFQLNIIDFLKSQEELEEIYFEKSDTSDLQPFLEIYSYIWRNLRLKRVQIYGGMIQMNEDNLSLEALTVNDPPFFVPQPWESLARLKYLKYLEISGLGSQLHNLIAICSNLIHLETLKLSMIFEFIHESKAFQHVNFPNLKEVKFSNMLLNHQDWEDITTHCPLIEKISLDMFLLEPSSLRLICSLKNFKELELGCGIYTKEIFTELENCSTFQHLKVTATSKGHLDAVLPGGRFKVTVNEVEIYVPVEEDELDFPNPYQEFLEANRNFTCLFMFVNNIRDFVQENAV